MSPPSPRQDRFADTWPFLATGPFSRLHKLTGYHRICQACNARRAQDARDARVSMVRDLAESDGPVTYSDTARVDERDRVVHWGKWIWRALGEDARMANMLMS